MLMLVWLVIWCSEVLVKLCCVNSFLVVLRIWFLVEKWVGLVIGG